MVTEKIQKHKRETDQLLQILNKLWPVLLKVTQLDNIDKQTKDILLVLG